MSLEISKIMKKIFACLFFILFALSSFAVKDVTKFLGLPVDGPKAEMIGKLKAKGFQLVSYDKGILEGQFNGADVNVYIATNGNKVCRLMVCDKNTINESSIRIRFNNLCGQFERNPKYMEADDYRISDDEDISYEMSVNDKRYQAVYYQKMDTTIFNKNFQNKYLEEVSVKYTPEQLKNPTEEMNKEYSIMKVEYALDLYTKKTVWFMISELYGKYYITMFYDNEYNRANGEDL